MAECKHSLQQKAPKSLVRLRVRLSDATIASGLLNLPENSQYRLDARTCAFWLGPDRWLLRSDLQSVQEIIENINAKLPNLLFSAVDSTDALDCFALSGQGARNVLSMGCGLDLSSRNFGPGCCRTTRFAGVQLVIALMDEDNFSLFVDRSYSHYFQRWLANAARDPLMRVS